MKNILDFLKKYYVLIILIFFALEKLEILDIWLADNLLIRIASIPVLILIIYLSFSDLVENDDTSFGRWRWIFFDIVILLLSAFVVLQTAYIAIKSLL